MGFLGMSYLDIFLSLGLRYQLAIAGILILIAGIIISSRGGKGGTGKACAWCGREIQGKAEKCSLCNDKFCSQKCMIEHRNAMHAPGY